MATNTPIKYSPYEKEGYKIDLSAEQIESALKTINLAIATGQLDDKTLQDINAIIQTVVEWDISDDSLSVKEQLINIYNSMLSQDEYNDLKPNIIKNPNASDGDVVETHLTVGHRTGDAGAYSFVSGGSARYPNEASKETSGVFASIGSKATAVQSVVIGGNDNFATADRAVTVGGNQNRAIGQMSGVLGGWKNKTNGACSVILGGEGNITNCNYQLVSGKYNIVDTDNKYIRIIGNGTDNENRSNAYTLDFQGNAWFLGDVAAGDISLKALEVRVAELEADMGDVETALDGIIAIQNSLMGVSE